MSMKHIIYTKYSITSWTKSQPNSVFLNQKLSFSNLFWTSVIITFSVLSDMVRTSHLSMIAGPKDHLCKILKALTAFTQVISENSHLWLMTECAARSTGNLRSWCLWSRSVYWSILYSTSHKHAHKTPRKLLHFYRTEEGFWPDFADIKHDYTQELYRYYSSFISKCPRTG